MLNTLERGELAEVAPVASSLVDHLQSRRALYLAMLLHDIAKGRGGDHSELGAEVALKVGPALGLSAEETETVSWLVLHHLLLSDDRVQARHRRSEDHPRSRRHDPVAGAAAAAAGADGRRHARGVAARSGTAGRRRCCANSMRGSPRCWPAGCPPPSATCACSAPSRPPRRCWRTGRSRRSSISPRSATPATGCRSIRRRTPATPA